MNRPLTVVDAVAWITAGGALGFAIVGTGWSAFTGLIVFTLVALCIGLELLGFEPGDLR